MVKAVSARGSVIGLKPLYRQVKDALVGRIGSGTWVPGQLLPSEPDIAAELGVSPGTVRKAMDEMTAENLLVRRQGRGTFVVRQDDDRILFQFFRMVPDVGGRPVPDSRFISVDRVRHPAAAARLDIGDGEDILAIERVRSLAGIPCIHEWIALPARLFPGLEERPEIPNNLYALFATDYGVTIAGAQERLKAVAAGEREAELLGAPIGEPMIAVDRVALALDGRPVEWRRSHCRTEAHHYLNDLK